MNNLKVNFWLVSSAWASNAHKFSLANGFTSFCGLFIAGSKTNWAACCNVWYVEARDAIDNKGPRRRLLSTLFVANGYSRTHYYRHTLIIVLLKGALWLVLPYQRRQKWPLSLPFWAAMQMAKNRNKTLGGNTTNMPEKSWNIVVHALKCK